MILIDKYIVKLTHQRIKIIQNEEVLLLRC